MAIVLQWFNSLDLGQARGDYLGAISIPQNRKKVLVCDLDGSLARRIADHLWKLGMDARITQSASEARDLVEFWRPHVVLMDLNNALTLFRFLEQRKMPLLPSVIVSSRRPTLQVVERLKAAGVRSFLEKPFTLDQAVERIRLLVEDRIVEPSSGDPIALKTQELQLLNIFLKQATDHRGDSNSLHNLMRMMSIRTGAVRASIIQCKNLRQGTVLASNDDSLVHGFELDLDKYPEIRAVIREQKPKYISDVESYPLLSPILHNLQKNSYQAIALFPLWKEGHFFGVMSLRLKRKSDSEATYVQNLGNLCSRIISLTLREANAAMP